MFIDIVNTSIAASWLILAVMILRLLLKRAPRWITCVLWAMAGVRLVCPFSIKSIFSLVPSGQTLPATIEYDAVPQINSGISSLNSAVNPVLSDYFEATPHYSANPMQILIGIARYIWIIGIALMLLYLVVSTLIFRLRMRTTTCLRDNIMQSERVSSPFVMGIFRPRIYLPYRVETASLEHIIAHEEAHIARGDHIFKPLAFLVLTLHWFNPLVWVAYFLLCRDIETACDQRVIKQMDLDGRKDYSRALVHGSTRPTAAACPLAFGEVDVKSRVRSVLSYKKPALWIIIASLVLCGVLAACFLTDPVETHNPFGKRYQAAESLYNSQSTAPEISAGQEYRLTADQRLVRLDGDSEVSLGRLESIQLTEDNFDALFIAVTSVGRDGTGTRLHRQNQSAWRLVTEENELYFILTQNSGEVLIAAGGYGDQSDAGPSRIVKVFCMEEINETAFTDLDAAINSAVVEENHGKYKSGEFVCSAHTLLATENQVIDEDTNRLIVYAIVRYSEYELVDGIPEDVSGCDGPVALTFDITTDGQYTLVEYWTPRDGTLYVKDLEARFPDGVSWNTTYGHAQRKAGCYGQACEYFGVTVTTSYTGGADDTHYTGAVDDTQLTLYTTRTVVAGVEAAGVTTLYTGGAGRDITKQYVCPSEYAIFGESCLNLYSDGTAMLTFGWLSSYIAIGHYSFDGEYLVLTADDDYGNRYVFRSQGEDMMFVADGSADIPRFSPAQYTEAVPVFTDGDVFSAAAND